MGIKYGWVGEGPRACLTGGWEAATDDITQLVTEVAASGTLPRFLFGHSMGNTCL